MQLIIALVCLALLFKLQATLYKLQWKKGFSADIAIKYDKCEEGDSNVLTETVINNKLLPLPMVHVKFNTPRSFVFDNEDNSSVTDYYYRDDIFTILSHQVIKRELTFKCTKRGCFYMNDINITTSDLLMRDQLSGRIESNVVIHVYPKKLAMTPFEIPFNTIMGDYITQKHIVDDPFEFRGIREYQPYDPIKSINWKSSARHNELQVNTFFTTSSRKVVLLLNLDSEIFSHDEKLQEYAISIASTLAAGFISKRIPVALETNGHDIFTKERICRKSGSGDGHMEAIDHSLSRIDLSLPYDNFSDMIRTYFDVNNSAGRTADNAFYIFISNYRHNDIMDYYSRLKSSGIPCYYIIPELKIHQVDINLPDVIKWEVE